LSGLLLGRLLLWRRRRREKSLLHLREDEHQDKRDCEDQQQAAFIAGLVLWILIFGQSCLASLGCVMTRISRRVLMNGHRRVADDRVVSAFRKWMAAEQSPGGQECTANRAIALDGLHRVFRACRNVAACGREQWRNRPLVASQQEQHGAFWHGSHR